MKINPVRSQTGIKPGIQTCAYNLKLRIFHAEIHTGAVTCSKEPLDY